MKLFKDCEPNDQDFEKYIDLFKTYFTNDSNEVARDKALEAVIEFLQTAEIAYKCISDILTGIFSKCLSGKEKSIKNSIKIIQLCVDHEQQLTVQEKLIEGLGNKTPKIIQISIIALKEIIRDYGGPKVMQFKPIIEHIPTLLEHRDNLVRVESKNLCIEMYKWNSKLFMKELRALNKLQDKQIDSLESECKEKKGDGPMQIKFRKSESKLKEEEEIKQKAEKSKLEEAERKKKLEEAELKAKKDAELKAQEEAEQNAKKEADIKSKEDAELKYKIESEIKSQIEADLKFKQVNDQTTESKIERAPTISLDKAVGESKNPLIHNLKMGKLKTTWSFIQSDGFDKLKRVPESPVHTTIHAIPAKEKDQFVHEALIECLIHDGRSTSG